MSEKTKDILNKIKELQTAIINFPVAITVDEKNELTQADSRTFSLIMEMKVRKICSTCEHCVFNDGQHCCAEFKMLPIEFQIKNDAGGCTRWKEKDFIPF